MTIDLDVSLVMINPKKSFERSHLGLGNFFFFFLEVQTCCEY